MVKRKSLDEIFAALMNTRSDIAALEAERKRTRDVSIIHEIDAQLKVLRRKLGKLDTAYKSTITASHKRPKKESKARRDRKGAKRRRLK